MKILKYSENYKEKWDSFVKKSKNGTFLFFRDYMEYHKDRFRDLSFIILDDKENIIALIPGCILENVYYTHKGLTYGGLILNRDLKMKDVLLIFELLNCELRDREVKKIIYKCIPNIYHKYPSQEEEYALFTIGAKINLINISSTIDLREQLEFNKSRKSCISKSKKFDFKIEKDLDYRGFWEILTNNLQTTYGVNPVHSLEEIIYLKKIFPDNIKLYTVKNKEKIVAGVLIYEDTLVAHVQYISANKEGKESSALDFIFNYLIKEEYKDKKYFDFGTSTENNGKYLNEGLIFQKEGFGARGIVYKTYEYSL